jgi:hypothetical protein
MHATVLALESSVSSAFLLESLMTAFSIFPIHAFVLPSTEFWISSIRFCPLATSARSIRFGFGFRHDDVMMGRESRDT